MAHSTSPARRWMLWAGGFFLAVFAALIAVQIFIPNTDYVNADELARLEKSLAEKPAAKKEAAFAWPQWRGPHRDGHSSEQGLRLDWSSSPPKQLWEKDVGDGYGSIAVAAGRVVTGFQDGDDEVFACFDAATGDVLWRHAYAARFKDEFGSGPRSTPTIDRDLVFTVGGSGMLHCLELATKTVRWRVDLINEFAGRQPRWGFSFSPLVWPDPVHGDLVLLNPGGPGKSIVALERATSKVRWADFDVGGGYSSPVAAEFGGVKQVVFFTAMGLLSVAPETGKELWRFPWKTEFDANIATPIILDEHVFIASGYSRGCAMVRVSRSGDGTFAVEKVFEHKKMCNHFSSCVVHKKHLYGFNESSLTCLDLLERRPKARWIERDFERGSLLVVDDHLIIFGENGRLGVAKADPASYQETGRIAPFEGPYCWSAPALANGLLYVRDRHKLKCFDLRK